MELPWTVEYVRLQENIWVSLIIKLIARLNQLRSAQGTATNFSWQIAMALEARSLPKGGNLPIGIDTIVSCLISVKFHLHVTTFPVLRF
jgi:hypothetical protein